MKLTLEGKAANCAWPAIQIKVGGEEIFSGEVVNDIVVSGTVETEEKFDILIDYQNKKDHDTVVDDNGNILENQLIEIKEISVNGIELVRSGLIYRGIGCYNMTLTPYKKEQLELHNQSTAASCNLVMTENGTWKISLEHPTHTFLTRCWTEPEQEARIGLHSVFDEIYDCVERCLELEKKINERT